MRVSTKNEVLAALALFRSSNPTISKSCKVSARPFAEPQHTVAALQCAIAGSPTNLDPTAAWMMARPLLKTAEKAMHSEAAGYTRSVVEGLMQELELAIGEAREVRVSARPTALEPAAAMLLCTVAANPTVLELLVSCTGARPSLELHILPQGALPAGAIDVSHPSPVMRSVCKAVCKLIALAESTTARVHAGSSVQAAPPGPDKHLRASSAKAPAKAKKPPTKDTASAALAPAATPPAIAAAALLGFQGVSAGTAGIPAATSTGSVAEGAARTPTQAAPAPAPARTAALRTASGSGKGDTLPGAGKASAVAAAEAAGGAHLQAPAAPASTASLRTTSGGGKGEPRPGDALGALKSGKDGKDGPKVGAAVPSVEQPPQPKVLRTLGARVLCSLLREPSSASASR